MRTLNLIQWHVMNPQNNQIRGIPRKNVIKMKARSVKQEPDVRQRRKIMLRRYDMGRSEVSSFSPASSGYINLREFIWDPILFSYQKRFIQ